MTTNLRTETDGAVLIVTIDRPQVRNAIDGATADELYEVFSAFDADDSLSVAILTGADGTFCAGADLKAISAGQGNKVRQAPGDEIVGTLGPVGPSRLLLSKPTIAAVEGHAVAGGLELAVWCDLRVAAEGSVFGVFCRRWGVPLVDGGTIRLPRLIGQSRALDMILTGREVQGPEAFDMGLANRLAPDGEALAAARELATALCSLPQRCLRSDRRSAYEQWSLDLGDALTNETELGLATIRSGETREGATRFAGGAGRHGAAAPTRLTGRTAPQGHVAGCARDRPAPAARVVLPYSVCRVRGSGGGMTRSTVPSGRRRSLRSLTEFRLRRNSKEPDGFPWMRWCQARDMGRRLSSSVSPPASQGRLTWWISHSPNGVPSRGQASYRPSELEALGLGGGSAGAADLGWLAELVVEHGVEVGVAGQAGDRGRVGIVAVPALGDRPVVGPVARVVASTR